MALDEDDEDFVPGPLLPPDDRLWRHPAELGPLAGPVTAMPARQRRPAALVTISGLTGAVLALSLAAAASWFEGGGTTERSLARSDPLSALERLFGRTGEPDVAATVGPAVVHVRALGGGTEAHGSGVVFRPTGEIVTAAHLVDGADAVRVRGEGGDTHVARVLGVDRVTGLAVIDVDARDLQFAELAWKPDLAPGERVMVVGRDRIDAQVSTSTVGAVDTGLAVPWGSSLHGLVRTESPARSSDVGGALVTASGAVVGVVCVPAAGDALDASAYAVAGDIAARVADELVRTGAVHHAFLGVEGIDLTDADRERLGVTGGALVVKPVDGAPAAIAGLVRDDVIVGIGGRDIDSVSALVHALHLLRAGESVRVTFVRDSRRTTVTVVLDERTV